MYATIYTVKQTYFYHSIHLECAAMNDAQNKGTTKFAPRSNACALDLQDLFEDPTRPVALRWSCWLQIITHAQVEIQVRGTININWRQIMCLAHPLILLVSTTCVFRLYVSEFMGHHFYPDRFRK